MDIEIAHEVFVRHGYEPPAEAGLLPDNELRIVDLGANVGLTSLYYLTKFPKSRVVSFEPHPLLAAALRHNINLNGLGKRLEFHEAAAGISDGMAFLTDAEIFSRVVAKPGCDNIPEAMAHFLNSGRRGGTLTSSRERLSIRVVDIFEALGQQNIDLLKLDIEGEEHSLLGDVRFASLPIRTLVVEWHDTRDHPDGRAYALERLISAGHRILSDTAERTEFDRLNHGVIWTKKHE